MTWSRPASTRCGCPRWCTGRWSSPFIGMAYALSRTARLKVGTGVSVLPGRHPVLVAKQLASLAGLAPGPGAAGLRPASRPARASGTCSRCRPGAGPRCSMSPCACCGGCCARTACPLHGEFFTVDAASIGPRPAKPLDIWLGGTAPGALRRVGRLADGWLASLITPDEAGAGRAAIEAAAAEAGREVEPDHFGISLAVGDRGHPGQMHGGRAGAAAGRRPGRPGGRELAGRAADDRGVRGPGPEPSSWSGPRPGPGPRTGSSASSSPRCCRCRPDQRSRAISQ